MLSRIQQTDLSVPIASATTTTSQKRKKAGSTLLPSPRGSFPGRTAACWAPACHESSPVTNQLLLNLNALAEGHSFLTLDTFEVSDDNAFLAYSTDTTGFRQYTLQIKDLASGQLDAFRAERVTSAAWAADNRTLFYTVEDEVTKRSHRLYRHTLGSTDPDPLLLEESVERFRLSIERTRSGAYLLLLASHTASEVRFISAGSPPTNFAIASREDTHDIEDHPTLSVGRFVYRKTSS
jgi:oligopeptidase B